MSLCGLGISCEPAPCIHGKELRREQCHFCYLQDQIYRLQNRDLVPPVSWVAIHKMQDEIDSLRKVMGNGQQPYKCPVCHGMGSWELVSLEEAMRNGGSRIKKCDPCEGKGIIWG
jgi:hypothetical protein